MPELDDFETRFTVAFGRYLDKIATDVDAVEIAEGVAASGSGRVTPVAWPALGLGLCARHPALSVVLLAILLLVTVVAAASVLVGSGVLRHAAPGLLAYSQPDGLYTYDPLSGRTRQLAPMLNIWWVGWLPDGSGVRVEADPSGGGVDTLQDWTVGLDGSARPLSRPPSIPDDLISWTAGYSPDWQRYAAVAQATGELVLVDRAGNRRAVPLPGGIGEIGAFMIWSPDGQRLAFDACSGCVDRKAPPGPFSSTLWVVNVDGTGLRAVASASGAAIVNVLWSPDGSAIAYGTTSCAEMDSYQGALDECYPDQLFVVDLAGGRSQMIWAGFTAWLWDWSSDGRRLALHAIPSRDASFHIYVFDRDSDRLTQLTEGPQGDARPTFSADGSMVAFVRSRNLWIVNVDGSDAREIAKVNCTTVDCRPAWGDFQPTIPAAPRR